MSLPEHKPEISPVDSPLLSREEISELMHRALQLNPSISSKLVAHKAAGENPSVFRGVGPEFEDSRQYQPGDELRHINWRLSARSTGHFVKIFHEERRPGTFILVDRRSAMRFGTRTRLKVTQGVRIATMLAFTSNKTNVSVGAVILEGNSLNQNDVEKSPKGTKPVLLRERDNDADLHHLLNTINRPCPPVIDRTSEPTLVDTLKLMQSVVTRGSNVFLISDFADLTNECRTMLAHLSHEHMLRAIHIIDPVETTLPKTGKLRLQEGPGQKEITANTSDTAVSNAYAAEAKEYIDTRQKIFSALGIPCIKLYTNTENIEDSLQALT